MDDDQAAREWLLEMRRIRDGGQPDTAIANAVREYGRRLTEHLAGRMADPYPDTMTADQFRAKYLP